MGSIRWLGIAWLVLTVGILSGCEKPGPENIQAFFYIGMIFFKGLSFCHELLPNFFLGHHLGDFPYFKLLQDLGVMKI